MKKHISFLLLILMLPSLVFGQSIDNNSGSLDAQFETPSNMTDKQMTTAKEFTHQGIKDRKLKEGCAKANDCKADEDGMPLEMLIGKAYVLMGMVTGGGMVPTLTGKPSKEAIAKADEATKTAQAADPKAEAVKPEGEKKTDWCGVVAMAQETLGGVIQQSLQKKAEDKATKSGDAQIQALYSLEATHKGREKTAKFQAYIYTTILGCYAVMAATGQAQMDWKYYAKVAGAGALSVLYFKKANKHKKAAAAVAKVIDSLPKAGDCNPYTKTACFCSELTSKSMYPAEYQEVCVLNNGNFDTPKVALGCAAVSNGKATFDKECKCKQSNSCLKTTMKAYNPNFGIGNNLMNDVNKSFDLLSSGEFDEAKLQAATLNSASLIGKIKPSTKLRAPKVNLNDEQRKIADELKQYMPEAMANVAAASSGNGYQGGIKDSPAMGSSAISKLPDSIKDKLAEEIKVGYKQGSGNDFGSSSSEPDFVMPNFGAQEKGPDNSTEVISFAEQAVSKADVTNRPETPIFDIISNRYRRSGWDKLERFE